MASHKYAVEKNRSMFRITSGIVGNIILIPSQNSFDNFIWKSSQQLKQNLLKNLNILA